MRFRFLAVLIAVLMVFALMPGQMASAAEGYTTGDTCPECNKSGMIYVMQYDNDQHAVYCGFCGYGLDETGHTLLFENHWYLDDDCVCDGCGATIHKWKLSGGDFTWTGDEENGYTSAVAVFVCNASSESHTEIREAKLETKVIEPTCKEDGKTVYTATLSSADSPDGKEYVFSREAKKTKAGHTVHEVFEEPTCTEYGHKIMCCTVCGEVLHVIEKYPPKGHDWGEWVVLRYPTKDNYGLRARTCRSDGSHVDTEKIDKIDVVPNGTINTYTITFTSKDPAGDTKPIFSKMSKGSIIFTVKGTPDDGATFDNFAGVLVDGQEVPENNKDGKPNYTAVKGSLILELQSTYLETLEAGKHTVSSMFSDGDPVTAEFTVAAPKAEPENDNPRTGDESSLFLWAIIAAAAACGIALALRRRQRA